MISQTIKAWIIKGGHTVGLGGGYVWVPTHVEEIDYDLNSGPEPCVHVYATRAEAIGAFRGRLNEIILRCHAIEEAAETALDGGAK